MERGSLIVERLFAIRVRNSGPWAKVLLSLGLVLTGLNIVNSVHDYHRYNATDLRIRIVGIRAMLQATNPYTLDYSPSLPETLQDPDQYNLGLPRCSYPPTLLLFYAPFAPLHFRTTRLLSMILEWCAMLGVLALLSRTLRTNGLRLAFVIIALSLVSGSYFWRLHIERGQYHIFLTLLFAGAAFTLVRRRKDSWLAGVLLGLALAVRPTTLVALVVLALRRFWRVIISAAAVAATLVLLTLPLGGRALWQDWRALASRYEAVICGERLEGLRPIPVRRPAEGYQPGKILPIRTENSSIHHAVKTVMKDYGLGAKATPEAIRTYARLLTMGLVAIFVSLFCLANIRKRLGVRFTVAYSLCLMAVAEHVAPIRSGYADVQLLLPIALLLPLLLRPRGRPLMVVALLALAYTAWSLSKPISDGGVRALLSNGVWLTVLAVSMLDRIRSPASERQPTAG